MQQTDLTPIPGLEIREQHSIQHVYFNDQVIGVVTGPDRGMWSLYGFSVEKYKTGDVTDLVHVAPSFEEIELWAKTRYWHPAMCANAPLFITTRYVLLKPDAIAILTRALGRYQIEAYDAVINGWYQHPETAVDAVRTEIKNYGRKGEIPQKSQVQPFHQEKIENLVNTHWAILPRDIEL